MVSQKSICVLVQGWYGQRIVLNLKKRFPPDWTVKVYEFPTSLPTFIEEPEELLPKHVSPCNLILSLGEHPAIALLLPSLVKNTKAEGVIVPIDNSDWVPPAVKKEVSEELTGLGVVSVFPKPFCSMEANSGNKLIDEFAKKFGRPKLNITLKNDLIINVDVLRGSPCGSTHFVAERLLNINKSEAAVKASLFAQTYPCLASRQKDIEYGDSLIHVAGYILKSSVLEALKKAS